MRVFVTGASGFVGSAVVGDLLAHGHMVVGLVRSDKGAAAVTAAGAEAYRGDINDLGFIKKGAAQCDAVIHTAFNHDFSRYKQSCEDDRVVIQALGDALVGTKKPLVITSGIGIVRYNRMVTEADPIPVTADVVPRAASEEAARAVAAKGVDVYVVRLPPSTHGKGDYGFVPMLINIAKEKGAAAYINDGQNRWPAAHRYDAASVYRLAIEKQPSLKILHAVAEQGIPFKQIAETLAKGLKQQVISVSGDEVATYFTWFKHFAEMDCEASAELTKSVLGWTPSGIGLVEDVRGNYFV